MDLTIVDVARMVGVSQAAVSRVLNDPGKVKETTRDRVLQVMEENDYVYNALAARKAIAYLVSMGHRRIAFISGNFLASGRAKRRWEGYKEGLESGKLFYDQQLVIQTEFTVAAGRDAAHTLLQLSEPPTAILCGTDILAYGVMVGTKDKEKKIGAELSIIGFDDLEMPRDWIT